MFNFKIVVPTYNRVSGCYKKTLSFLKDNKIPNEIIHLVVHNEEQKQMYLEGISSDYYGTIIVTNLDAGLAGQRNFIVDYFDEDTKIVSLDDDVTGVYEIGYNKAIPLAVGSDRVPLSKLHVTDSLIEIIKKGFELCEQNGYTLWGLYPVTNLFYMNKQLEYTKDLRFIVGAFMGFINKKRKADESLKIRQDYDLSVQAYLQDGGLIRFNRISVKYGIYCKNGGVGQSQKDRQEQLKLETEILLNKYPELVKKNKRRENEILLRTKYIKK